MSKAKISAPIYRSETRATLALRPDPRNARTHSVEQIRQLADLVATYGWTFPPLIDEHDQIIAGHGRWRAAQLLGYAEIPVRVAAGWSEEAKRVYVLADNKVALGAGWDDELLAIELGELADLGADLGLAGFGTADLVAMLGPAESSIADAGGKIHAVDTSNVADLFWIQVAGPLGSQADVLARLRAVEAEFPAVTVKLGTTERDAD